MAFVDMEEVQELYAEQSMKIHQLKAIIKKQELELQKLQNEIEQNGSK